jgi:hypothetical protein
MGRRNPSREQGKVMKKVSRSQPITEFELMSEDEYAEKDAALTDGELIAISNALQGTGYAYIADKLRAILAANKDK